MVSSRTPRSSFGDRLLQPLRLLPAPKQRVEQFMEASADRGSAHSIHHHLVTLFGEPVAVLGSAEAGGIENEFRASLELPARVFLHECGDREWQLLEGSHVKGGLLLNHAKGASDLRQ